MQVNLSPVDAGFISELVKNGFFQNEEEALSASLEIVREQYEAKRQGFLAALSEGDADIEAGRYSECTPELLDSLFAEAMAEE